MSLGKDIRRFFETNEKKDVGVNECLWQNAMLSVRSSLIRLVVCGLDKATWLRQTIFHGINIRISGTNN